MSNIRVTHGTTMGAGDPPDFLGNYDYPSTIIELKPKEMYSLVIAVKWGLDRGCPDPDGSMQALVEMLMASAPRNCFQKGFKLPVALRGDSEKV